jgi:preprotein translocase subunit SecG
MYYLISVLIIVVCVFLVLIVLVQNSKGGGLASNFAGSNQIMGVRKTADFLEKATWTLAISLLVLSLLATATRDKSNGGKAGSAIEKQIQDTQDPTALPNFPNPTQQQGQVPQDSTKNK